MFDRPWLRISACLLLTVACTEEPDTSDDGPAECVGGQYCPAGLECVDGFCVDASADDLTDETGDGDGDPTTGDGDGDPTSGDGDGDGDGDPTSGDGDGDGDPSGDGDGDGDPGPTCGNGIVDIGEQCDGNNLNGFMCQDFGYSGGTLECDPVTCLYIADDCF